MNADDINDASMAGGMRKNEVSASKTYLCVQDFASLARLLFVMGGDHLIYYN